MATHTIRTTIRPDLQIVVDESEYQELFRDGLIFNGTAPLTPADFYDAEIADRIINGTATPAALKAAYVAPLPTAGSYTYNADGTIASDPDGNTYTWNADGTPKTQTKGGVTRTFNWNADGTLAGVS